MPDLQDQLRLKLLGQNAEVRAAYEAMVPNSHAGTSSTMLAVGDSFPDVALPAADGELILLRDLGGRPARGDLLPR